MNFPNAFLTCVLSDPDVHPRSWHCEICPEVILNLGSHKLRGQQVNRKCGGKAVVFLRYCSMEKCYWRLSARKHVASRRVLQGCFFSFHCPINSLSHEITIGYKRKFSWPYILRFWAMSDWRREISPSPGCGGGYRSILLLLGSHELFSNPSGNFEEFNSIWDKNWWRHSGID